MGTVHPIVTDRARQKWLENYPAKFTACRQGHNFPKLIPRQRKLTRTWITLDEERGRIINQRCTCGRVRWRPLNPNNTLGGKGWKYKDPEGYAQPPGYGLTRADFANVYWPAIVEDIEQSERDMADALAEHNEHTS
jgi:hypothetical protein